MSRLRSVVIGICLLLSGTVVSPAAAVPSQGVVTVAHKPETKPKGQRATAEQQGATEQVGEAAAPQARRGFFWDDGIRFAGPRLRMHIAGLVENDSAAFVGVSPALEARVGPINNGVEWRRARVFVRGDLFDRVDFNFEYDFAVNSPPKLKNAYIGVQFERLVLGNLRVHAGRFQTPLSLEGFAHNTDTTFLERATVSAFFPDRNTGVLLQGDFSRTFSKLHWNVAFTYPEDELGVAKSAKASPSARLTWAFDPPDSDLLLHVGVDYLRRYVDPSMQIIRTASQPEAHIAPIFVDTGDIAASGATAANLEVAVVKGPLSFQGEHVWSRVDAIDDPGVLNFSAFYAFVSYFLTGETRPYDETRGSFYRVTPKTEFRDSEGGRGAFEVAFRFSRIDLTDKQVDGGSMDNFSAALNWYATRHARVSTNVIRSKLDGLEPVWIVQARLQWAY